MTLAAAGATVVASLVAIAAAQVGGRMFTRLRQPPVIGELLVGLALGAVANGVADVDELRAHLDHVANVGLACFLFLMGLEVDRGLLRRHLRGAATVSLLGLAVPFALGVGLGLLLVDDHGRDDRGAFVLFVGTAMAITAFPVLARILHDRRLQVTALGTLALAAAAVDDLVAWLLLATVVVIATSGDAVDVARTVALLALFGAVLLGVVVPLLRRLSAGPVRAWRVAVVVLGLAIAASSTDAIGVHLAIGAFAFGVALPRGPLAGRLEEVMGPISHYLLPVVFVVAGSSLDRSAFVGGGLLGLVAVVGTAFAGKLAGGFLGARLHGLVTRDALGVAVLMNTRGLAELVVATVGLDLGVLDDDVFGWLVVMTLVTTVAAAPLLDLIRPDPDLARRAASV